MVAHLTPYSLQTRSFLGQATGLFYSRGSDWTTVGRRSLAVLQGTVQQQAALLSSVEVFRIMAFLFLAIIPLILLMRKAKSRGARRLFIKYDRRSGFVCAA